MAKTTSKGLKKGGIADLKSRSKPHHVQDMPAAPRPPASLADLHKLDLQEDVVESHEQVQAPSNRPGKQLWLLQLPAELDLSAGLTWDVKTTADGRVRATCQDVEGTSFTMVEQAKEVSQPMHMVPAAGSKVMPKIVKTMKVTETDKLLPDPTADAERVQAAMPSADIPGIPVLTDTRTAEAAGLDMSNKAIQQQQERQEQQAGQDMMAAPKQKQKKAKSESKKLKKRAQEVTAINEKQSKLQRQSSAPLMEPAALQVSASAAVQSEAAKIQDDAEPSKPDGKKEKKSKEKKHKKKKRKDKDSK